jgi:hypothetical protein
MISLPLPPETEQLIVRLSDNEKQALSILIQAFVTQPKRSMPVVMDAMAEHAKRQGLAPEGIEKLLSEE